MSEPVPPPAAPIPPRMRRIKWITCAFAAIGLIWALDTFEIARGGSLHAVLMLALPCWLFFAGAYYSVVIRYRAQQSPKNGALVLLGLVLGKMVVALVANLLFFVLFGK